MVEVSKFEAVAAALQERQQGADCDEGWGPAEVGHFRGRTSASHNPRGHQILWLLLHVS